MRYRTGTARARRCRERTAWRGHVTALAFLAACGDDPAERSDGVAAGSAAQPSAVGTETTGKPACPATGSWQMCSVVERLERAGLAPREQSGTVTERPLAEPGTAFLLGGSELRVFLFADADARARAQAALDKSKYVAPADPVSLQAEPTLIASENLLAILRSRNDRQRERVSDALTAGPPQRRGPRG